MAEQKENPKSCERCGSTKEPINIFNPNTSGYPTKRIALCAKCAAADSKVTFVSGPGIAPPQEAVDVPDIAPAVPNDPNVVETKEFGPKPQESSVAPPEPIGDVGPVPPEVLKQKLAKHEKDHNELVGKRQQLQGQLAQIGDIIQVKRGAIAQLRDLLGNAS